MKIVVLAASLTPGTGNETTARRIAHHLESSRRVKVFPVECKEVEQCKKLVKSLKADLFLGIHLYRSGRLIAEDTWCLKSILVVGGTDVNENIRDEEKVREMQSYR